MAHVSNFAQDENKIILDLINDDNNSNLTAAQVSLSAPVVVNDKVAITVSPKQGSGYVGNVADVTYNRLDIQAFVDVYFPETFTVQQGEAVTVADLLDEVNTGLGTLLTPESIVDGPIPADSGEPNEVKQVALVIAALNLVYSGSAALSIDPQDIPISSVISQKNLSGLNLPENGGGGNEGDDAPPGDPLNFNIVSANYAGGMFYGYQRGTFGALAEGQEEINVDVNAIGVSGTGEVAALHYEPGAGNLTLYYQSEQSFDSGAPFNSIYFPGVRKAILASNVSQSDTVNLGGIPHQRLVWEGVLENPMPEGPVLVEFR